MFQITERIYPPTIFACASGDTYEGKYLKLHEYFQGQNTEGIIMKMTLPVFLVEQWGQAGDRQAMCRWVSQDDQVIITLNITILAW